MTRRRLRPAGVLAAVPAFVTGTTAPAASLSDDGPAAIECPESLLDLVPDVPGTAGSDLAGGWW